MTDKGRAELTFLANNGTGEVRLHTTDVNLLSTSTMSMLAKELQAKSSDIAWRDILTHVTGNTIEFIRRGEPAEEIWPTDENVETRYLVNPLLYLGHPTVIFGDYGSLKSLVALMVAYVVQLPYTNNCLALGTLAESTQCLYLDYEDDRRSFARRLGAIQRGFGEASMPICYRRMTRALSDDVDQIAKIIADKDIKFLIIDSLGPAARGNLNDPEPAIKYHAALRELGITSLTLAHNAKSLPGQKPSTSIFGSVFFTNLARSVWQCKSDQEAGDEEATVMLKHMKANLSRLHPPLGFKFKFGERDISIRHVDISETALETELSLSTRITAILRGGEKSLSNITAILDNKEETVRRTLYRMAKKEQVVKVGQSWGLRQR